MKTVVLLIGMAVGVDYALFYVVRSREERRRGVGTREAVERASATAGRSVLVAGLTAMVAMAGQFVVGSSVFNGIASGTIVVVACAVVGSVTVVPAVLVLLGPRLDRGRVPLLPHLHTDVESGVWAAIVERVLRRPVLSVVLAGARSSRWPHRRWGCAYRSRIRGCAYRSRIPMPSPRPDSPHSWRG